MFLSITLLSSISGCVIIFDFFLFDRTLTEYAMDKKTRSIRPFSRERYNTILSLINKSFNVAVKERSLEQKRAVLQFYRAKSDFSVRRDVLHFRGKRVLLKDDLQNIVKNKFNDAQGSGARALNHRIQKEFTGISEHRIQSELAKSKIYARQYAKFTNKPPLKSIISKNIGDRWQIDLINMRSEPVQCHGQTYQYILSVIDVFSRFLICRPLQNKSSKLVCKTMNDVFLEYGTPKVLQCDNGTEFKGSFDSLLLKKGVKKITSRPYHPESQGKCERSHRTLRRKLGFLKISTKGSNWVTDLPTVVHSMNTTAMEVLNYQTPFEIYFGRQHKKHKATPNISLLKQRVRNSTARCANRMQRYRMKASLPSMYEIGEKVLIRFPTGKSRIPRRRYILSGRIVERRLRSHKYLVKFQDPRSSSSRTEWVGVENITSETIQKEKFRKMHTMNNEHRKKYLIPFSHTDRLEGLDLIENDSVTLLFDPKGDGNCQFEAVVHQLSMIGIFRTASSLRTSAVDHLKKHGEFYRSFVCQDFAEYIQKMSQNGEYGDNLTLQALARELNLQFLIISANGLMHCKIISNDGKFDEGLNVLCLGYFPEGQGEHYVSIDIHPQTKEYIIENIETHNENELQNGRVDELMSENSFQQKENDTFSACNISVNEDRSSPIELDESCDNDVGHIEEETPLTSNCIPSSVDECSKEFLLDPNSPPPVLDEYKSPFPRESDESCDNDVGDIEEEKNLTSNCIPSTVDECSKDFLLDPNSPPNVSDEYNSPHPRESDESCDNAVDGLEKETPSTCKRPPTLLLSNATRTCSLV